MFSLDIRTIVFSNLLTAIVGILVLLLLWRQSRGRFRGMGLWVFDFIFQTIALFLIVLRGSIPDWTSIVLSNTLVIAGAILGYIGLERFVGRTSRQIHNFAFLAVFAGVHAYFLLVQPNIAARTLNLSVGLLIICLQCAWLLLRGVESGMRPLTRGVGGVFVVYCLVSVIRIIRFFVGPDLSPVYFQSGVFESIMLVCYQLLFIILAYSLILMVNKRLHLEIKTQEMKFSKAFHSSSYAITLTRLLDGQIEEVNEAFLKITGYRLDEVIGATTIDLNLWKLTEDRVFVLTELSRRGRVDQREFQFRTKGDEVVTGLFSAEIILIYGQKYVLSSISDVTDRKRAEEERERLIVELKNALAEVKTLRGFIPICAGCKKIRDDEGYWQQVEKYVQDRSEAQFSHGICPDCMRALYPDIAEEILDGDDKRF
ncbi:MAG: PAS domain S-box protein [Pseudomonadota bacterium]